MGSTEAVLLESACHHHSEPATAPLAAAKRQALSRPRGDQEVRPREGRARKKDRTPPHATNAAARQTRPPVGPELDQAVEHREPEREQKVWPCGLGLYATHDERCLTAGGSAARAAKPTESAAAAG